MDKNLQPNGKVETSFDLLTLASQLKHVEQRCLFLLLICSRCSRTGWCQKNRLDIIRSTRGCATKLVKA